MNRFATALVAGAVLLGTAAAPTAASAANGRNAELFAAGALGLLGGAVIAGALAPAPVYAAPAPVYVQPRVYVAPVRGANPHVAWCSAKYRSYSPYDNTWIDLRGNVRNCASPYGY